MGLRHVGGAHQSVALRVVRRPIAPINGKVLPAIFSPYLVQFAERVQRVAVVTPTDAAIGPCGRALRRPARHSGRYRGHRERPYHARGHATSKTVGRVPTRPTRSTPG